jgi:hypothetical protein
VALLLGVSCADEGCEKGNIEIMNKLLDVDLSAIVVVVVGGELDRVKGHEGMKCHWKVWLLCCKLKRRLTVFEILLLVLGHGCLLCLPMNHVLASSPSIR